MRCVTKQNWRLSIKIKFFIPQVYIHQSAHIQFIYHVCSVCVYAYMTTISVAVFNKSVMDGKPPYQDGIWMWILYIHGSVYMEVLH